MPIRHSVVVAFYNEADNVPDVLSAIRAVLDQMAGRYEALFVNDGSSDGTAQRLSACCQAWPEATVLNLPRNVGQAGALLVGFRRARGEWILTLDGDGQNDPADFPALLDRARATGADLVVGVRTPRNDSWLRRAMSRLANAFRRRVLHDGVSDSGCALKAMRREVVDALVPIRSLYSFIPAMAVSAGFVVAEAPVRHHARRHGKSSYGFSVFLWRPAADMLALWWLLRRRRIPPLPSAAVRNQEGAQDS